MALSNKLKDKLKSSSYGGLISNDQPTLVGEVSISKIHEDEHNARTEFDTESLEGLSESIKQNGVLDPISLRPHDTLPGEYIINCGHRRFRASKMAGLTKVPAFLDSKMDDYGRFIDNIQREDLSLIDVANQLKRFVDEGAKNREIAQKIGKSETWVSRYLSLLELPKDIIDAVKQGKIKSAEAALSLANLSKDRPAEVHKFIQQNEGEISQGKVRKFQKEMKSPDTKPSNDDQTAEVEITVSDDASDDIDTTVSGDVEIAGSDDVETTVSDENDQKAQVQDQDGFTLKAPKMSIAEFLEREKNKQASQADIPEKNNTDYFVELVDAISLTDEQARVLKSKLELPQFGDEFDSLRNFINSKQG